jgi:hypothetical protein
MNEWRDLLEFLDSEDQSLWKMTKMITRVHTPSLLLQVPRILILSDSEKGEALAHSLEAHVQPVDNPSDTGTARRCSWPYFLKG